MDTHDQTTQQPIGTTVDRRGNKRLIRTIGIEILKSQTTTTRIEMRQSQTAMSRAKSTLSPDGDLRSKRWKRRDLLQSDNIVRQTIKLSF